MFTDRHFHGVPIFAEYKSLFGKATMSNNPHIYCYSSMMQYNFHVKSLLGTMYNYQV